MTFFTTMTDDEVKQRLTLICDLLTEMVTRADDEVRREGVEKIREIKRGRPNQPKKLPKGNCTFTYECNEDIAHWRFNGEKNIWIPVCKRHKRREWERVIGRE